MKELDVSAEFSVHGKKNNVTYDTSIAAKYLKNNDIYD